MSKKKAVKRDSIASHCSSSAVIASAMRILANDIQSDDGVANAAIREAADRIAQLHEAVKVLHVLLHRSQTVFVPSTDRACKLNYEALIKYEWMTKD